MPAACVHCWVSDPPCGRVEGAAPTRRMRRTGRDRRCGSSPRRSRPPRRPGTARSAPTTVTIDPSSDTSNARPGVVEGVADALPVLAQLPRGHVAQVERGGLARTDRHRPGAQHRLRIERHAPGSAPTGRSSHPAPRCRTGTWQASTHGAPAPESYRTTGARLDRARGVGAGAGGAHVGARPRCGCRAASRRDRPCRRRPTRVRSPRAIARRTSARAPDRRRRGRAGTRRS